MYASIDLVELALLLLGNVAVFVGGFVFGRATSSIKLKDVPDRLRVCANCRYAAGGSEYCTKGDAWRVLDKGATTSACDSFELRRTGTLIAIAREEDAKA